MQCAVYISQFLGNPGNETRILCNIPVQIRENRHVSQSYMDNPDPDDYRQSHNENKRGFKPPPPLPPSPHHMRLYYVQYVLDFRCNDLFGGLCRGLVCVELMLCDLWRWDARSYTTRNQASVQWRRRMPQTSK